MNKRIFVLINDPSYEYDVRSLLRAFFPGAEVSFRSEAQEKGPLDLGLLFSQRSLYVFCGGRGACHSVYGLDRPAVKNCLKKTVYDLLNQRTGRSLPWGTLTGIRPVRLVLARLREGADREGVRRFMYDRYRASVEKCDLAYDVAMRESAIIDRYPGDRGYCLYVGIPFCPSICLYCSFSSYPIYLYSQKVEDYLSALYFELDETSALFGDRPLSAVYIGGGTPTSLSADQLSALCDRISARFDLSGIGEWTIECGRPDSITREKLAAIRRFGDLRISINPQTFHQKTLDVIGRRHTTEDTRRAFALARETGFSHINMDLIVGLPGEGEEEVEKTLEEVVALSPDNVTVHALALKRASRLREEWERFGEDSFRHSDKIMERVFYATEALGMRPYYLYRQKDIAGNLENIGFAREGGEGIYNILIMEETQDIAACGAGAISKRVGWMNLPPALWPKGNGEDSSIRPEKTGRAANVKDVDGYIHRIQEMVDRKRVLFL